MRSQKNRLYVLFSILTVIGATAMSFWWQQNYWSDFNTALCSSLRLVRGQTPYEACYIWHGGESAGAYPMTTLYPMTTIVAFIPFALLPGKYTGAAFVWGAFSGLLMFGSLRSGKPWQLLIFLSAPYWMAFAYHQMAPLIAAVYLLPVLLPLALLKPQIGLPVILTHLTRKRLIACALFVALTFAIYPGWLGAWYQASGHEYDGVIPLLILPLGPLLLLLLFRIRDPEARFLLLMACTPQRAIYDMVALYVLPRSLRQMLAACFLGWVTFLPVLLFGNLAEWSLPIQQVRLSLALIYLPLLVMLTAEPAQKSLRSWVEKKRGRPV